jgi:hypothetical protein
MVHKDWMRKGSKKGEEKSKKGKKMFLLCQNATTQPTIFLFSFY